MKRNNGLSSLITPWVLITAIVLGIVGIISLILILNWSRPTRVPFGVVTAALTIIPAPTGTNTPSPTQTEPIQNTEEPPAPPEGELDVGDFVKISGTGGAGLRLRSQPGLDYQPRFLGVEDEVFQIESGPQDSDGYTWWYLVAPFDPERGGWAVSNYLQVIQEP
jgi:hypothetical protein